MPILDRAWPVLIFKASRDTLHHGALGVARTLGRVGVPVYAIVEDGATPLAMSRYVAKAFVWKKWPGDNDALLHALAKIAEFIDHPAILIPMDDLSTIFVAENASSLSRWFVFPNVPTELPRRLANKASFYSLCAGIGVSCPKTLLPASTKDVREFVEQTGLPIVVKATDQWLLVNDRRNAFLVRRLDELLRLYDGLEPGGRSRIILQEYVPGEDWIYHGYCNCEADLYLSFTGKKLLSYPPDTGSTALGISIWSESLRRESEKLLRAVRYSGITDMDWRLDSRDGQYRVVDCNPRVGMNFRIFENTASIDVIRAQHLDLTGRSIDYEPMIEGRQFSVESFNFLATMRGWRPRISSSQIAATTRGDRELAWWSKDDPLPFCVMWTRLVLRTIGRAWQRLTKRFA